MLTGYLRPVLRSADTPRLGLPSRLLRCQAGVDEENCDFCWALASSNGARNAGGIDVPLRAVDNMAQLELIFNDCDMMLRMGAM